MTLYTIHAERSGMQLTSCTEPSRQKIFLLMKIAISIIFFHWIPDF